MKSDFKINNNVSAHLIIPDDTEKPLPALIFVHGWESSKKGNVKRSEEISKNGFICLSIDLRGHGESEGTLKQFSRQDHLEDIKSAYKYITELKEVDQNKIGIVGASYGGYLAAVAVNYLKFDSLVLRVPALYFDDNFNVSTSKLINGDPKAFKTSNLTPEKSLALKGIKNFPGDILIIESENDTVIPHAVIENYLETIEDKRRLTYKVMKNTPHALETETQEKEYVQILSEWLDIKNNTLEVEV